MEKNTTEKRDKALSFLTMNETGVLATVSPDGKPHARLLYYTSDESFNIYFITLASTRKVADMKANPHVAFTVSTVDMPQALQLEGTVTDLTETATNDPLIVAFIQKLIPKKPYGIPLEHLDTAVIRIFKITPDWVRFGDFTYGEGTNAVLTDITPTL
jgi:uncharacterized pyridoxamine 5'-phosphate oxidase family protein